MLIREHATKVIDGDTTYVVWICGEERVDGTWEGWLEFHPTDTSKRTFPLVDPETIQWPPGRISTAKS